MYVCKIFLSIIFIFSNDVQNVSSTNTSELRFNLFHKNSDKIHTTMNQMFASLKLKKSFKKTTKIRLLLTMHKNLINILSNSDKNGDNNDTDIRPIKEQKHNIIDEILAEEYSTIFFSPSEIYHYEENRAFNDSIAKFFSGQFDKNLLKIHDTILRQPIENDTSDNQTTENTNMKLIKLTKNRTRELKAWVPENQNMTEHRRIFRSMPTKITTYPFMASVHIAGEFTCSGSIISEELVLTAASCLQMHYLQRNNNNYMRNVSVRIGSPFTKNRGQIIPISEIYFHPLYNSENLNNNLVVLRMSEHKHFSKKRKIRRVLFNGQLATMPKTVKQVTIVGWGARNEMDQIESSILTFAHLDLYNIEECKSVYTKNYVSDSNFCAGFETQGGGACSKDIGDPAIVGGYLVGVVSFGPPLCGTPDAPTVFTKVGLYARWIDSLIKMDPIVTQKEPILRESVDKSLTKPRHDTLNQKDKVADQNLPVEDDEISVLKEILTDFALSNGSGIRNLIDEGFDSEFVEFVGTSSKVKLKDQSVANRSPYSAIATTTNAHGYFSDLYNIQNLEDLFKMLYHQHLPSIFKLSTPAKTNRKIKGRIGRKGSPNVKDQSYLYTTPTMKDTSHISYESDSEEEYNIPREGLNIEWKHSMTLYGKPENTVKTTAISTTTNKNDSSYSYYESEDRYIDVQNFTGTMEYDDSEETTKAYFINAKTTGAVNPVYDDNSVRQTMRITKNIRTTKSKKYNPDYSDFDARTTTKYLKSKNVAKTTRASDSDYDDFSDSYDVETTPKYDKRNDKIYDPDDTSDYDAKTTTKKDKFIKLEIYNPDNTDSDSNYEEITSDIYKTTKKFKTPKPDLDKSDDTDYIHYINGKIVTKTAKSKVYEANHNNDYDAKTQTSDSKSAIKVTQLGPYNPDFFIKLNRQESSTKIMNNGDI